MRPLQDLTRRERLVRFRALAKAALAAYGLEDGRLKFIQYTENITFRVDRPCPGDAKGSGGPYTPGRYLLRIHAMYDEEAIASELTWLVALNQAGLPVPAPISTRDGNLIAAIVTPGIPQGRIVSLMRWLDGQKIDRGLCPKHLEALGEAVARLHAFSVGWQPPAGFKRCAWDWDSQLGGSMFDPSLDELVDSMPPQYQAPFQAVSQEAKRAMQSLGKGPDAYGLIHSDLYPENVLFKGGKAYPIDFEDCGYGYWMWDIVVALC